MTNDTAPTGEDLPVQASTKKIAALAALGLLTLALAGLMFTLSFDALRALAVEIGVRPSFAWMAPVAIDIAQAAGTLAVGVIGVNAVHKRARRYCMGLTTVTVVLSVAGNSYHAYQLAERNLARIVAGEDIGFIPQHPWIAAIIAGIFPLLWLALLHMFNKVAEVIAVESKPLTTSGNQVVQTAPAPPATAPVAVPQRARIAPDALDESVCAPAAHRFTDDAQTLGEVHILGAHAPLGVHPDQDGAHDTGVLHTLGAHDTTDAHSDRDGVHGRTAAAITSHGWPQTTDGLTEFVVASDLPAEVKEVALILIDTPDLKQAAVAEQVGVDRSTVSRRWKSFVKAAGMEGFTVPPLPKPMLDSVDKDRELQPA